MVIEHREVFFDWVLGIGEGEFGGLYVFDVKFGGVVGVGLFQHVGAHFYKMGFVY